MKNTKISLAHEELILDEKINVRELPSSIKASMNGLNLLVKRYEKSPTDSISNAVRRKSIEIADEIQDWLEDSIDEEKEIAKESVEKKAKEVSDKQAKEVAEKQAKEVAEKEVADRDGSFGNSFLKGIFGI